MNYDKDKAIVISTTKICCEKIEKVFIEYMNFLRSKEVDKNMMNAGGINIAAHLAAVVLHPLGAQGRIAFETDLQILIYLFDKGSDGKG